MSMSHQSIRLPDEVIAEVRRMAEEEGRNMSNMYQRILVKWAEENKKKAA